MLTVKTVEQPAEQTRLFEEPDFSAKLSGFGLYKHNFNLTVQTLI